MLFLVGSVAGFIAFKVGKWRHMCINGMVNAQVACPLDWSKGEVRIGSLLLVAVFSLVFATCWADLLIENVSPFIGKFSWGVLLMARWQASGITAHIQAQKRLEEIKRTFQEHAKIVIAESGMSAEGKPKCPSSEREWAGLVASLIQGTIEEDGAVALRGTVVLVRCRDNGIELRHHAVGDNSRLDFTADPAFSRYCYLRDCEELDGVLALARLCNTRDEIILRTPVDLLARSAARQLGKFLSPSEPTL
jgi:hypothetical protein